MSQRLDTLPDDVLLLTLGYLDTARDIASLALSCKRLYLLVNNAGGWRIFVRKCFPSLAIPDFRGYRWDKVAESLTWQTRCWERRSFEFTDIVQFQNRTRGRRVPLFQPIIAAHINPELHEELLVWGAGEDIVARRRTGFSKSEPNKTSWYRLDGEPLGYKPGYDDVGAISIVADPRGRDGELAILSGRHNGDLRLLSAADDNFGEAIMSFRTDRVLQDTVNSVDVRPCGGLFAAATKSHILLYPLSTDQSGEVELSNIFDICHNRVKHDTILSNARWMGDRLLALGMTGCKDALRYLTITPSGLTVEVAAKNEALYNQYGLESNRLCTDSIQPLSATSLTNGTANLLLSAWRDGTCRLQDIRTPSPWDIVYCDNIDPWADFEALLPFGTDHFVAGGTHGATLKVFDFRWPKDYYHTTALPCGDDEPFPIPHQPFISAPTFPSPTRACCDHLLGHRCRWHELSRDIYYRPNSTFFLAKSLPKAWRQAGVWTLAKASDVSPNFYAGISGALVEVELRSGETKTKDPNFGFMDDGRLTANQVRYTSIPIEASMMETGDGLASVDRDRNIRIPQMRGRGWRTLSPDASAAVPAERKKRHRLAPQYQAANDYGYTTGRQSWRGSEDE